jgi:hypothetical protein
MEITDQQRRLADAGAVVPIDDGLVVTSRQRIEFLEAQLRLARAEIAELNGTAGPTVPHEQVRELLGFHAEAG